MTYIHSSDAGRFRIELHVCEEQKESNFSNMIPFGIPISKSMWIIDNSLDEAQFF